MIERYSRLMNLWRSRRQNLDDLASLESLDETLTWTARHCLLGFNTSAIRLRILYSLAQLFRATEFVETGTYHGATAICAHNSLRIPVRSCEALLFNFLVAKLVTCGLSGIQITKARSELWLSGEVERLRQSKSARPFFYLDAHPEADPASWPVPEELSQIFQLETFLVAIDDFAVQGKVPGGRPDGPAKLEPNMIRPALLATGIGEIFLPSYSVEMESGYARTGFAVIFRSRELDGALRSGQFPFNLLEPCRMNGAG